MISQTDAERCAIDFLMAEWELPETERNWFFVVKSRAVPDSWWYFIEISIKDLPDKWVIQVFEDGECDPCYTFNSPFTESDKMSRLEALPQRLVTVLKEERSGYL